MNTKTETAAPPDAVFRALSDRTRLRILRLLQHGELCVCHLVDALRISQPKASRHLAYLRSARLVVSRRDGLWIHYKLAPAATKFHKQLLLCIASCEGKDFEADARRLKHGECC